MDEHCYLVNIFVPIKINFAPKYVIFLFDATKQYSGDLTSAKSILKKIVQGLHPEDTVSLISFNGDGFQMWDLSAKKNFKTYKKMPEEKDTSNYLFKATKEIQNKIEKILPEIKVGGERDLLEAFDFTFTYINDVIDLVQKVPMIIYFSEGTPTLSEELYDSLPFKINQINTRQIPLYTISNGDSISKEFLENLADSSDGYSYHFQNADSIKENDFYIHSTDIKEAKFRVLDNYDVLENCKEQRVSYAQAMINEGPVGVSTKKPTNLIVTEKQYVVLTIQDLLEYKYKLTSPSRSEDQARNLSIAYGYVTKLTSLKIELPVSGSLMEELYLNIYNYDEDSLEVELNEEKIMKEENTLEKQDKTKSLVNNWMNLTDKLVMMEWEYEVIPENYIGDSFIPCDNPPVNTTIQPQCTLISMCLPIAKYIKTMEDYQKYFCGFLGYAGVCCPF